jgi:hypothetical protein
MSFDQWIVIPRWEDFQHRDMARSSVPPWIKTYTRLLANDDYLALSHHLRGVLLGIWLEYARSTRQLRGSTSALSRRLGQRVTTRDLQSLNDAGFIGFSASKPASNLASALAGVEVEVEVEPPLPPLRGDAPMAPKPREPRRRDEPPAAVNGSAHYLPGKLRYLTGAQIVWNTTRPDEREQAVRNWLEGFTGDPQEVQAHIDALHEATQAA